MDIEGASGTVDSEKFLEWVKQSLCPTLGRFAYSEPRSIVVMDNASTHMTWEVSEAIRETGAYLLYTAPYSPDLNPIERAFNVYKKYLKRHETIFQLDPITVHNEALHSVSKDFCVGEYRRCNIPKSVSPYLLTSKEKRIKMAAIVLYMIMTDNL